MPTETLAELTMLPTSLPTRLRLTVEAADPPPSELVPVGKLWAAFQDPTPRTLRLAPGVHAGIFELKHPGFTIEPAEGDRTAAIDGWLEIHEAAADTTIRGLEITSRLPPAGRRNTGLGVSGPRPTLERLYVHECGSFGVWSTAENWQILDCVSLGVGYADADGTGHGHALYLHSKTSGTIRGGIFGQALSNWAIHAYTEAGGLDRITIDGPRLRPSGKDRLRLLQVGGLRPVRDLAIRHVATDLLYLGFGRQVSGQTAAIEPTVSIAAQPNALQVKGFWDRIAGLTRFDRAHVLIHDDATLWDRMAELDAGGSR